MTGEDVDERASDACEEALERAREAMLPADDPDELKPDYPADMTPEERVDHVLANEYPRWRSLGWIAAAADTDVGQVDGVVAERLAEGELEVSGEGVRRSRYHVYFDEIEELTEQACERPRSL